MTSEITAVGLDLAKNVFQIHAIDAAGMVRIRRHLRRGEVQRLFGGLSPCLVGLEACASSHHWTREIAALGHEVKMMPPAYVKPYVKRGKTDAADAGAICEAVTRPTMRFVPTKTAEQQSVLMLHKARELLVRQRTMLTNAVRAHLDEYGMIAVQGPTGIAALKTILRDQSEALPAFARTAIDILVAQSDAAASAINELEIRITAWHRSNARSRRLATIPGVGPITASAIAASVPDSTLFRSGRQFAAWIGLTPRAHSSGGKDRPTGISKQGDAYIRRLLVVGATAVLRYARKSEATRTWTRQMLERKQPKVVAVALANKTARIAWVLLTREQVYGAPPTAA